MPTNYKEQGIRQIQSMLSRWTSHDGEFNAYIARRSDTLKMIGTGNTSGAFALAVFLTTGTRVGWMAITAKILFVTFALGIFAFMFGYRGLYRFAADAESAMYLLRKGTTVENSSVVSLVEKCFYRSERSAAFIALSLGTLLLGSIGSCIAVLLI